MTTDEIYAVIEPIGGWFSKEDVEGFSSLELPKDAVIFEAGTYCGRSTTALGLLFPDAKIFTTDPVDTSTSRHLPENATYYCSNAVDIEWDRPIDLLFIDDSHFYSDIVANYGRYEPFVKPGGYVVFHDYHFQTSDVDAVRRVVNELQMPFRTTGGEFGLAIFQKP